MSQVPLQPRAQPTRAVPSRRAARGEVHTSYTPMMIALLPPAATSTLPTLVAKGGEVDLAVLCEL